MNISALNVPSRVCQAADRYPLHRLLLYFCFRENYSVRLLMLVMAMALQTYTQSQLRVSCVSCAKPSQYDAFV